MGSAMMNWTDVSKVRMQMESLVVKDPALRNYKTMVGTATHIIKNESLWGLCGPGSSSSITPSVLSQRESERDTHNTHERTECLRRMQN